MVWLLFDHQSHSNPTDARTPGSDTRNYRQSLLLTSENLGFFAASSWNCNAYARAFSMSIAY